MTNDTITHPGVVENIQDSHLSVRIVQTSACASCSIKGHCSSADSQEKVIDIFDPAAASYHTGEEVTVVAAPSMGVMAVILAFVIPLALLVVSLFLLMAWTGSEMYAGIGALAVLLPYYLILWLNKSRLKRKFSFTVKPNK